MRTPLLALICWTLLLNGCVLVPAPYSDQLDPVAQRYKAVKVGVARADVEAALGAPSLQDADGARVWETRIDELNYAKLKVWFNSAGTAQKLEITRAHGKITPSFRSSAVVTRTK